MVNTPWTTGIDPTPPGVVVTCDAGHFKYLHTPMKILPKPHPIPTVHGKEVT